MTTKLDETLSPPTFVGTQDEQMAALDAWTTLVHLLFGSKITPPNCKAICDQLNANCSGNQADANQAAQVQAPTSQPVASTPAVTDLTISTEAVYPVYLSRKSPLTGRTTTIKITEAANERHVTSYDSSGVSVSLDIYLHMINEDERPSVESFAAILFEESKNGREAVHKKLEEITKLTWILDPIKTTSTSFKDQLDKMMYMATRT